MPWEISCNWNFKKHGSFQDICSSRYNNSNKISWLEPSPTTEGLKEAFPSYLHSSIIGLDIGGGVSSPHKTTGSRLFTKMALKGPVG